MSGTKTVVHFLRHGEVHNPERILYGRLPGYRLSDQGAAQAKLVAEFLSGRDVQHVVASPLQRAQETAAPIGATFALDVDTDERLIESANLFEGLRVSVGDGALRSPQHWPKLRNPFRPSWGEPYVEIAHRMFAAAQRARVVVEQRARRVRWDHDVRETVQLAQARGVGWERLGRAPRREAERAGCL